MSDSDSLRKAHISRVSGKRYLSFMIEDILGESHSVTQQRIINSSSPSSHLSLSPSLTKSSASSVSDLIASDGQHEANQAKQTIEEEKHPADQSDVQFKLRLDECLARVRGDSLHFSAPSTCTHLTSDLVRSNDSDETEIDVLNDSYQADFGRLKTYDLPKSESTRSSFESWLANRGDCSRSSQAHASMSNQTEALVSHHCSSRSSSSFSSFPPSSCEEEVSPACSEMATTNDRAAIATHAGILIGECCDSLQTEDDNVFSASNAFDCLKLNPIEASSCATIRDISRRDRSSSSIEAIAVSLNENDSMMMGNDSHPSILTSFADLSTYPIPNVYASLMQKSFTQGKHWQGLLGVPTT